MVKTGDTQTCQLLRVWRVIKGSNLLGHVRSKVSVSGRSILNFFIEISELDKTRRNNVWEMRERERVELEVGLT